MQIFTARKSKRTNYFIAVVAKQGGNYSRNCLKESCLLVKTANFIWKSLQRPSAYFQVKNRPPLRVVEGGGAVEGAKEEGGGEDGCHALQAQTEAI